MRWRTGLSLKFGVTMAIVLVVLFGVVLAVLQRHRAIHADVSDVGGNVVRSLMFSRLHKRGEALLGQVAGSLANPLYYFDLDAIRAIVREANLQPDVAYVLVYDTKGDVIHDGSGDIPAYGQAMSDPLAYEAIAASGQHSQWADGVWTSQRRSALATSAWAECASVCRWSLLSLKNIRRPRKWRPVLTRLGGGRNLWYLRYWRFCCYWQFRLGSCCSGLWCVPSGIWPARRGKSKQEILKSRSRAPGVATRSETCCARLHACAKASVATTARSAASLTPIR